MMRTPIVSLPLVFFIKEETGNSLPLYKKGSVVNNVD